MVGFIAKAQLPASTFKSRIFTGNTEASWIILDSPVVNPIMDTFYARYQGTQIVRIQGGDTAFWFYGGNRRWLRGLQAPDTISLSNRINFKLNISDTTNKWWGIGKRWVDSLYRINDSTIGFTINNGAQQTFQILGRVSGGGGGGSGTVSSVGLSMPSAFSVSGSPITSSGTLSVSGAGTTLQYIRGNGTLGTFDTAAIPNFYLKVRGLLTGTSPITFNQTTGAIGINNANTSGTKGAASFTGAFSDNGSGLIDLLTLVAAGSCTGCNLNIDAKGRITGYSDGAGSATNNVNIGSSFRWLNAGTQEIRTVANSNTIGWDSVSTVGALTAKADTSVLATQYDLSVSGTFNSVLNANPNLFASHVADFQANSLYFTNGQFKTDSTIFVPTESFMSTDSILGIGHSIANYLGASSFANSFIGLTAAHFNKPWANWAQISSGITRVVWQHNTNTGPGNHRATIAMGALNTIRSGWTNIKSYRKIMNAYKAIFCNQFAEIQDSASGANATRSGSGWTTYAGQADAAKFNTTSYTNVQNDSISYSFSGPGVGVTMMGTDSSASQYIGSVVNIKIDGISIGTFSTNNQTDGVTDPISGFPGHRSPMAFIVYGLANTNHTITIVNTEAHYMYVDYFCTFVSPSSAYPLLIMNEPYMGAAGYAGVGSNALIDAFNHGTDSMVATLPQVLPVYVGKTNTVYNAGASTSDIAGDGIHPNDLGHTEIFTYSVLPAIEHASAGKMLFTNNSLYINDGTQYRKVYDTANLLDATATIRGLVGIGNQTWAGTKTFLKDIIVNSVRIGNGAGNYASNTFVGSGTGLTNNGDNGNTALGQDALVGVSTGYFNTAIGRTTLANTGTGTTNTALGHAAGNLNTGSGNVFLGYSAGSSHTIGSNQLYIANNSSSSLIWGSFANNRVVIGSTGTPSDNTVGTLQVRGKLTVDEHAVASNSDSAVVWNRSTNAYEVAKINSATTIYSGDGTLAGTRTISGAGNNINFGTGGSNVALFTINSSSRTVLNSGITYGTDASNTDANYTVPATVIIAELSDVLSTGRTLTLPTAATNGQCVTLVMRFSAGSNKYSLSSAVTDNATGSTFTTLDWGKTYDFMVDQSVTWRLIRKY